VRKEIGYKTEMSSRERKFIEEEVNILASLRHRHIVKYFDHEVDGNEMKVFLYMEYCENGDLSKLITHNKTQRYHPETTIC